MSIIYIGDCHPESWLTGKYEQDAIATIFKNINSRYKNEANLLINGTWFSKQSSHNTAWAELTAIIDSNIKIDNLFYMLMIDPDTITTPAFNEIVNKLSNPTVHKIGNFTNSEYSFYIFSYMISENFKEYTEEELRLTEIKHTFINYNRKPKPARVQFVNELIEKDLDCYGLITLGKGDRNAAITINEDIPKLDTSGDSDTTEIPNDIMTLGDIKYWKHHFLNVVTETDSAQGEQVFISEKIFKPIIGLRPFIINGNVNTYKWLRNNGFKTFNHLFPVDLENPKTMQDSVVQALEWLAIQDSSQLMQIYNDIYEDLLYNKRRFFEYASEQKNKMQDTASWRERR